MERPDLEKYVEELETELDRAQEKFDAIYSSVRATDKIIYNTKKNHRHIYGAARSVYNKLHKKSAAQLGDVTHPASEKDAPLKMIFVNDDVKRLNLILDDNLDENTIKKPTISEILALVTNFANKHDFHLRIITRKNLANPKVYLDFLKSEKISAPKNYSFYTDIDSRLAPVVHRLEVSKSDIFLATSPASKKLVESLNLPAPKGVK